MISTFQGVIGHEKQIELLGREADSPAGAYLFVGASGTGKATVALAFAASILCADDGVHETTPIDECRTCRLAMGRRHPDLVIVEPSGRQTLGVEQARETIGSSALAPIEANHKIFLLESAGSMTEQAANSLLKTLEEPSKSAVFILIGDAEADFPETVVSRSRTVFFGRVAEDEIVDGLRAKIGGEEGRLRQLAQISGGRPGLALTLETSPEVAAFREAWLSVPERAIGRAGESFLLAQEMLGHVEPLLAGVGTDLPKEQAERQRRRARADLLVSGLEILASWYLDASAIGHGGALRNPDVPSSSLTAFSARRGVANADRVLDAIVDLRANLRPQLLLADLFCDLAPI